MSIFKSLSAVLNRRIDVVSVLNTPIDKLLLPSSSPEPLPVDERLRWRQMSLPGYKAEGMPGRERQKLDLRYTAYGEVSSFFATHIVAKRHDKFLGGFANAIAMEIEFSSESAALLMLVNDSDEGFASEKNFSTEIAQLRSKHQGRIGELSSFEISRDNKSRRAIGALFHVLYLYARQARQMNYIFVRTEPLRAAFYEQMMGFSVLSTHEKEVLMGIDLNFMKQHIRNWGGRHKDAAVADEAPYKLYPFFFPPQDEAGLLFRVLEHLGSASEST